jgi:hypothetical protein
VVYVDVDPVAVAHSRAILGDDPTTKVVQADLRDVDAILTHPDVTSMLDFDRPIAVLMVAVLHFIPDADDPAGVVARFRDAVPDGSLVVISHASQEGQPVLATSHQQLYRRTSTPMTMRTRAEIAPFFEGLDLVEPGLAPILQWRPESPVDPGDRMVGFAGVGTKAWTR